MISDVITLVSRIMENAINQLNIELDGIDNVDIPNLLSLNSATSVKVHNDSVAGIRNKFNTIQQSVDVGGYCIHEDII